MSKKSHEIQRMVEQYLLASGAKNEWYDEEECEDIGDDLVHCFLSGDVRNLPKDRLHLIYQEGGGEGEGEHVEAVFKLDDTFYKATWSYYSHYGYSWDGLEFVEVVPREKLVIVYDEVKEQ